MAVVPGHHHAVRELRPVPRARFFFAEERRQLDIFIAGIFSETPQAGSKDFAGYMPVSGDARDTQRLRGAARHAAIVGAAGMLRMKE